MAELMSLTESQRGAILQIQDLILKRHERNDPLRNMLHTRLVRDKGEALEEALRTDDQALWDNTVTTMRQQWLTACNNFFRNKNILVWMNASQFNFTLQQTRRQNVREAFGSSNRAKPQPKAKDDFCLSQLFG